MQHPLIIALDFPDKEITNTFLTDFQKESLFVKIGMELFYKEGPAYVKELKAAGHQIFLDLKLHDIPNTVYHAARQLAALEVDLMTVHAAGGAAMMEAALAGAESGMPPSGKRPKIVAVTQLTSTDETMLHDELLIEKNIEETVLHYAQNAQQAGLDGVVCSAFEVPKLKKECGESLMTVTPGIRAAADNSGDQKRVATPARARKFGSDMIVVGRSITRAASSQEAYQTMNGEWNG